MYQMHISVTEDEVVYRLLDHLWIPMDEANIDYQAYLEWLAEGNEPEVIEND